MNIKSTFEAMKAGNLAMPVDPSNWDPNRVTSFVEFGSDIFAEKWGFTDEQASDRFADLRRWMEFVSGDNGLNAIYLDTTTLHTAREIILGKERESFVTPATLFDLSTFVNSVVLCDHIFYLENQAINPYVFNESLGNEPVVQRLPVESFEGDVGVDNLNSVEGILNGYWERTRQYVYELRRASPNGLFFEDAREIKRAWKTLLEFSDEPGLWFDPSERVKGLSFHSVGPGLTQQLVQIYNEPGKDATYHWLKKRQPEEVTNFLHKVIDECNYRSLFNSMVSSGLQLHYTPNAFRLPFRSFFYKRAKDIHKILPSIESIELEYKDVAKQYQHPNKNNLHLPFFLAALLNEISTLDEFFPALIEMRKEAADFRRHRAELEDALERRDSKTIDALREALRKDSKGLLNRFPLAPVSGAIAAVLAACTSGLSHMALAAIGILTFASQYPPEKVEKLKQRSLKRQFSFLTDIKDSATGLGNIFPKIRELWQLDELGEARSREAFAEAFARLGSLSS